MPHGTSRLARARLRVLILCPILVAILGLLLLGHNGGAGAEDRDLLSALETVPAGLNGYRHLLDLEVLLGIWPPEKKNRVADLVERTDLDLEEAQELLVEGREVLAAFRRCRALPRFQAPGGVVPSFYSLQSMVHLASLESAVLFREGRERQAFDLAVDILRLGQRVEADAWDDSVFLIGTCLQHVGYLRLQALLEDCHLRPEELTGYVGELSGFHDILQAFARCQRREYSWHARLKQDRIKEALSREYRRRIRNAGRPFAEMDLDDSKEGGKGSSFMERINLVERDGFRRYRKSDFSSLCWNQVLADGTRLLLALRAFQAARGHLPEALLDLAPEFIPEIPLDPFDGAELRYSRQAAAFHSVGDDLIDRGGGACGFRDASEPTFFLSPRGAPFTGPPMSR